MAQQTFSGVPGDFTAGQVLTAADMDKLREFLLYLIKDGDETDTGEVSPLILDLGNDRVGINTDAPETILHIKQGDSGATPAASHHIFGESDGDMGMALCGGSSSNVYIRMGDSADAAEGGFNYDNADDSLMILTNNKDYIKIKSTGNVAFNGNGTTFTTSHGLVEINQPADNDESGLAVRAYQNGRTVRLWASDAGVGYLSCGDGGGNILNLNQGGGKVGVGTDSPASTFTVAGNIRTSGSLIIEGTAATAIRITQTDADGAYISFTETDGSTRMGYMGYPSNDDLHVKNETAAGRVYLSTNNTTRMSIAAGGLVNVVGEITAGTKTFDIPHPTKGGDWRLRHASIEGPRNDLIYRGTVTLSGGTGTVDLDTASDMTDGTWQALCRDPWAMVASSGNTLDWSLSGKTLTVTSDTADAVCSWMVIAERHDDQVKGETCPSCDDDGNFITEYEKEPDDEPEDEPDEAPEYEKEPDDEPDDEPDEPEDEPDEPEDEPDEAPEGAA